MLNAGFQRNNVFGYEDGIDRIDVSSYGFTDFTTDLLPLISTINNHTIIDLGLVNPAADRLVLVGQNAADLDADDFILS